MEKLCVFCNHFNIDPGCPGYSEYTPGYSASIECFMNHWEMDMFSDTTETYRKKILTAKTCKDYEFCGKDI